jgi:hypothetical protein
MVKSVKKPEAKPDEVRPGTAKKAPPASVRKPKPAPAPIEPAPLLTLRELAEAILADQILPSLEQSKALAAKVLKNTKPKKAKKAKVRKKDGPKAAGKSDKKAKAKAGKNSNSSTRSPEALEPKVRLPKLRAG